MNALTLATFFHDTYERLAPSFGYETRQETRTFDPDSANGKLMIAVCEEILHSANTHKLYDPLTTNNLTPNETGNPKMTAADNANREYAWQGFRWFAAYKLHNGAIA